MSDIGHNNTAYDKDEKANEEYSETGFSSSKMNGDAEKMDIEELKSEEPENRYFWGKLLYFKS